MQECMYISVYVGPMLVCMHVAYVCVRLANNFINRRVTTIFSYIHFGAKTRLELI